MKTRIITIFAVLTAVLCLGGTQALASPSISLVQTDYTGYLGTIFKVEVWLDSDDLTDTELLGFGFDVEVEDETVYRYAGYLLGEDFEYLDYYQWGYVGGTSYSGVTDQDVLLATLYFTITGEGSCELSITAEYDDSAYGLFYFTFDEIEEGTCDINVTYALGSPVPVPSSLLLLGSGIAALCSAMRQGRKKA